MSRFLFVAVLIVAVAAYRPEVLALAGLLLVIWAAVIVAATTISIVTLGALWLVAVLADWISGRGRK